MFTRDDMLELAGKTDRDDAIRAVNEIPDEDVRTALVLAVMLMHRNAELENAVWRRENKECNRLQKELDKAVAEIAKLKAE